MARWDGPGLDAWAPWTPPETAARLAGAGVPWCVVGGWAIDCFLGEQSREHEDIEVEVFRADFQRVRDALNGFVLHSVGDGEVRRLADDEDPPSDRHQNWVLDEAAQRWRLDVMLQPGDPQTWVYRRNEQLQAPRSSMVRTSDEGVPYLGPHGVLFYKAKNTRPKDELDFANCLPKLDDDERRWLDDALAFEHPTHPWRDQLRRVAGGDGMRGR